MSDDPINNGKKPDTRFKPGNQANPTGRPKGSRNKLADDFIGDLAKVWAESGLEALRSVKDNDPSTFVRVVAGLMPKDVNVKHTLIEQVREMSDEEIIKRLRSLQDDILPTIPAQFVGDSANKH